METLKRFKFREELSVTCVILSLLNQVVDMMSMEIFTGGVLLWRKKLKNNGIVLPSPFA